MAIDMVISRPRIVTSFIFVPSLVLIAAVCIHQTYLTAVSPVSALHRAL
jgi:hypothetical protein